MGIPEKLEYSRIVYTLGLWAPACLESGRLDSGRLVLEILDIGLFFYIYIYIYISIYIKKLDSGRLDTKKLKLHFTVKSSVADYDIFKIRF